MEREVYRLREERTGVSLEGSIKPFVRVREFTVVRLIENGRMSSALAEGKDEGEALRLARETLRFSKEEDYHLPTGCRARWVRTFEVDIEDLAGELSSLSDELKRRGFSLGATVELITRRLSVESTAGADVYGTYSFIMAELEIGGKAPFQVYAGSSNRMELEELLNPYINLVKGLEPVKPPKGNLEVIMAPTPLSSLLLPAALRKFRGGVGVKEGTVAKPGEAIASPLVTLLDDPLDENSLRYVKADDEGVRARKNVLIGNGIVRGLLWDSHSAWKAGMESTGNGIRIEERIIAGSHNLTLVPGNRTLEGLISEIDGGFIALGLRGANALDRATGDFSVVVTPALIIERGEVVGFSCFELRGNVWELLRNATGIGRELTRAWFGEGFSISFPFLRTEVVI
ncbi:TldE/PmbA protein, part of proposed TldE/TldD proteolytic complex (PMID 12029038) [Thermococcus nautili]|uniref:TldD/PmbA family protein n=1 Tax=Thermococcus nautili TaxID=195522 RepID=UPI002553D5B9|nr:TldD/PmbA family protein [Thermococcus nautili]CAI1493228.1 TldE/PmbA protein, part of proposed TldE/TldD proteolytic complex (PMID 12029038) [Thermococcus nautili]